MALAGCYPGLCPQLKSHPHQASWQLGYYAGLYKRPIPSQSFDIGAARKAKKMTQTQLAELMGVDQAHISRWERGEIKPAPENLAALKKILLD